MTKGGKKGQPDTVGGSRRPLDPLAAVFAQFTGVAPANLHRYRERGLDRWRSGDKGSAASKVSDYSSTCLLAFRRMDDAYAKLARQCFSAEKRHGDIISYSLTGHPQSFLVFKFDVSGDRGDEAARRIIETVYTLGNPKGSRASVLAELKSFGESETETGLPFRYVLSEFLEKDLTGAANEWHPGTLGSFITGLRLMGLEAEGPPPNPARAGKGLHRSKLGLAQPDLFAGILEKAVAKLIDSGVPNEESLEAAWKRLSNDGTGWLPKQ